MRCDHKEISTVHVVATPSTPFVPLGSCLKLGRCHQQALLRHFLREELGPRDSRKLRGFTLRPEAKNRKSHEVDRQETAA